jgi:predicted nicotinamide N-methyase
MFTLDSFKKQYDVSISELVVRKKVFQFFVPRSLDSFLKADDLFQDFPLWVKIWEASFVLAEYVAGLQAKKDKRFLEIGCGLGVVGIVASSFGHAVTMTDYGEDVVNFVRANGLLNPPPAETERSILELDWHNPGLEGAFDYILGSEVTFREKDFDPVLNLFKTYLKEGGEIILAGGLRKTTLDFMRQVSDIFEIRTQKKVLRSLEKEIPVLLSRMKFRP